ncbi:MAG: Rpn family recombination-promoting nuclease/putative transposase, partial [Oscillospiraceae bacterium]|nr:Rpn family recombination-promoting nuclease/putative transposase [Oscillospiraceae bacterium]
MIKINEKEQNTNHDGGYKTILSIKENFLHFLNKYIEKPWTKNISLDDMEKIEKSFITPEFKHIDSDIIYKTRFNGSDMYFYVLLELQSTVD